MQLTVLMCSTAHHFCVCGFVHEKENLEGALFSVYVILSIAIIELCDKKYGDSGCLRVLINTNQQGLAQVILAVFILGEWGRAIC